MSPGFHGQEDAGTSDSHQVLDSCEGLTYSMLVLFISQLSLYHEHVTRPTGKSDLSIPINDWATRGTRLRLLKYNDHDFMSGLWPVLVKV